jgi:predicted nucleic acid-binding protein
VAERRKRIKAPEVRRFVELLRNPTILGHSQTVSETASNVQPLAREYELSAYDAAYLDLAIRQGPPLATLDNKLKTAGRSAGVKLFQA